jgi:predicted GNAT family acetyltransferase
LLPFGFVHLWRALKRRNKVLDFYLIGVKKEYRGRGVDLIMAYEMYNSAAALGFERGRANPMLENNSRVRAECKYFQHVLHRRRRVYRKAI